MGAALQKLEYLAVNVPGIYCAQESSRRKKTSLLGLDIQKSTVANAASA